MGGLGGTFSSKKIPPDGGQHAQDLGHGGHGLQRCTTKLHDGVVSPQLVELKEACMTTDHLENGALLSLTRVTLGHLHLHPKSKLQKNRMEKAELFLSTAATGNRRTAPIIGIIGRFGS